jgi:hypothetical protein
MSTLAALKAAKGWDEALPIAAQPEIDRPARARANPQRRVRYATSPHVSPRRMCGWGVAAALLNSISQVTGRRFNTASMRRSAKGEGFADLGIGLAFRLTGVDLIRADETSAVCATIVGEVVASCRPDE